ncbi:MULTISPECIES: hypothetical protein [Streptomyces]|uniref:Uncharacterized protein n=1 Tax=Streptomyces virginiae TaxID=1961 RepID=A0ABZ1T5K4_STRVG|nr:hypothetical protein [Streptomyces virginiae]WTB20254.1 hypothetical protein OG253_01275 [Streptomyces virginiae]
MPTNERSNTALLLLATGFFGYVAMAHPALIPALSRRPCLSPVSPT